MFLANGGGIMFYTSVSFVPLPTSRESDREAELPLWPSLQTPSAPHCCWSIAPSITWMAAASADAFAVLLVAHFSTADFPARASNQSFPLIDSLRGSKKAPNGLDMRCLKGREIIFGATFRENKAFWVFTRWLLACWDRRGSTGSWTQSSRDRGAWTSLQCLPDGLQVAADAHPSPV